MEDNWPLNGIERFFQFIDPISALRIVWSNEDVHIISNSWNRYRWGSTLSARKFKGHTKDWKCTSKLDKDSLIFQVEWQGGGKLKII